MGGFLLRLLLIFISGFFIGASVENSINKQYLGGGVHITIGIITIATYIKAFII